ncbi:MAG: class I SAM-dependent methyltransferase [Chloroflexota bacterium]|nr:class I SAM-dependent methyltransferase [Chloroflexota bacterium]
MAIATKRQTERTGPANVSAHTVDQYKTNYSLTDAYLITQEMVALHVETETGYRDRLLRTTTEERTRVFEECYTDLYRRFPWLNDSYESIDRTPDYIAWGQVIGAPPQSVYEIGSGDAGLARHLFSLGHHVTATEITEERGRVFGPDIARLTWKATDGVHLTRYAGQGSFDVVISNQVIEHLHPDDVYTHLREAHMILKPNGRYVMSTPHRHVGPSDIGRVIGVDNLVGMHLKEYSYAEVETLAHNAGFGRVKAVLRIPRIVRKLLPGLKTSFASHAYLRYLKALEAQIFRIPHQAQRRKISLLLKAALFSGNLFVVLEKA